MTCAKLGLSILEKFRRDRRGNVGIIFSLAALPLIFSAGMGLDYVSAARKRAAMDALADSAALAAVTPAMMGKSPAQAQAIATSLFLAQVGNIKGVTFVPNNLQIVVTDTPTANSTVRSVTVNYTAASPNTFANLLGLNSLPFKGVSSSSTATAPNIDFYLMLDTSPSMAIAATTAGIATMVANTPSQGGCAFACHQTNPSADNLGNPGGIDNYALARNLGVPLRMDLVTQATQNLMDYAASVEASTSAVYRMAVYTFDFALNNIAPLTSNLTTAKNQSANINFLTVYKNGWRTSTINDNDQDTDWDGAISGMNLTMPIPGNGTNNLLDRPQEVLFIVTDGVADEANGGRKMFAMGGATCTAIKARGIKIAILYTTYNPLPTNAFYNSNIKPFQPNIGPTLQTCATPGLYNIVNTGEDITAALTSLFNRTVATAHLTR